MITNRDIDDRELFARAVGEIVESARENGVRTDALAETLREHAAALESGSRVGDADADSDADETHQSDGV